MSPACIICISTSATAGIGEQSISATHIGSTSAAYSVHFTEVRWCSCVNVYAFSGGCGGSKDCGVFSERAITQNYAMFAPLTTGLSSRSSTPAGTNARCHPFVECVVHTRCTTILQNVVTVSVSPTSVDWHAFLSLPKGPFVVSNPNEPNAVSDDSKQSFSLELTTDTRELVAAAKREMVSSPVNDSATTARLVEQLNTLRDFAEGMSRGIEQFTYLKASELQVLSAISKDITHPRHIGRRIGMDTEVVTKILLALEEKRFIYVSERIGERIIDATITDTGHGAIAQAEAVQFRSLDAMIKQAATSDTQRLLALLDEATALATKIAVSLASVDVDQSM